MDEISESANALDVFGAPKPGPGSAALASRQRIRVLVADADATTSQSLTRLLTEWGYDPVAVSTGAEALQVVGAEGVSYPGSVELDVARPQRRRNLPASAPAEPALYLCILVIGSDQYNDVADGLRAGSDDYLRQPYDPQELRARLETGSRTAAERSLREREMRFQSVLQEREADLQLLLDSTGEAIYGVDLNGNCTFSNRACLGLLGYRHASDLLGKNMHQMMHHSRSDGSSYPEAECLIEKTFRQGVRCTSIPKSRGRRMEARFPASIGRIRYGGKGRLPAAW